MIVEVSRTICKDVEKLPVYVRDMLDVQIENLIHAETLSDVANVIKMQGTDKPYYRLKFGNYRLLLYYNHDIGTLKVLSLTHRKDTYKRRNLPWR